jgi:DNA polymerase-3 subunit gamma/tau
MIAAPAPIASAADNAPVIRTLEDIAALAAPRSQLKIWIENNVSVVRLEPGRLEFCPVGNVPNSLAADLAQCLSTKTGTRWMVTVVRERGAPTLAQAKQAAKQARHEAVLQQPLVRAVMDRFPGAEIIAVRDVVAGEIGADADAPMPEADED